MSNTQSTWKDVRRIADELELQIHLAGMDARDRWRALKPRIADLEQLISKVGKRVGATIDGEVASISAAIQRLRDEMAEPLTDDD